MTDEHWNRDKARKGGYAGWCKECGYARRDLDKVRAAARRYANRKRAENPEAWAERTRQWRASNPNKWLAWARDYEAGKRERKRVFCDVTPAYVRELLRKAKRCPLCNVRFTEAAMQPSSKEVDHIVPLCIGGTHTRGNLRVICKRCNRARPLDGSDVVGQPTLWAQL